MVRRPEEETDPHCEALAAECRAAGLLATIVGSVRVRVGAPGTDEHLTETVTLAPFDGENGRPFWWWSWGEKICPASDIVEAAKRIRYVVTPSSSATTWK
jgi:hypothetical protein